MNEYAYFAGQRVAELLLIRRWRPPHPCRERKDGAPPQRTFAVAFIV